MVHWKDAEKDFEKHFDEHGKGAAVFRLPDTAAAKAVAGPKAFIAAQPSDYIIALKGTIFFAEVKSTFDESAFHFSNIQKGQMAASRRVAAAGGAYLFFVKSQVLNQWFCIPAHIIHQTLLGGVKHLKWAELKEYKYEL